jgi:site-specific DNA recombinase
VAYHSDRWHRGLDVYMQLKAIESATSVRFLSATQEFQEGPEGQFMENTMASMNQFYSQLIGKKVKIKRHERALRGEWNGGCRPYGYTSVNGRLLQDPEQAEIVRHIFSMFREHPSSSSVRNRLRALGYKDRTARNWSNSAVETIVRNPVYAGYIRHNNEMMTGIHEPIISREEWHAIQAIIPTRERLVTKIERTYLLSSLIKCGHCCLAMTRHYVSKKNGAKIARYRCITTMRRGWSDCSVKEVNADRIEAWVTERVRALAFNPAVIEAAVNRANESDNEQVKPLREEEERVAARIREVSAKLDRLTNILADGGASFQSVRAKLTLEEQYLLLLEQEHGKLQHEINRLAGEPLQAKTLARVLSNFDALYQVASQAERQELLALILQQVTFNGPGKEVTMEFYANVSMPSATESQTVNPNGTGSILRAVWLRR